MENPFSREEICARLDAINAELEKAANQAGRRREDIHLMAVTKTVPAEQVNWAIEHGVTLLGENRAQELLSKYDDYNRERAAIHFIGHLQTNKVGQIIDKVDMIDSVDRLRLAKEIDRIAKNRLGRPVDIMVEVNIGAEDSKSGILYEDAPRLLEEISHLDHLRVRGLMCIPPICQNTALLEGYFEKMYQLFVDMKGKNTHNMSMDFLSMGMSGDYPYAVKHGANIVRLGSSIFGKRKV